MKNQILMKTFQLFNLQQIKYKEMIARFQNLYLD
jgi:hypothetical protein